MNDPDPTPSPFERIACALGDLTREQVDAIVNAADSSLRGGGGVDGAIHRAAGPRLLDELIRRYPAGCPTGEVRITGGHGLPARFVIHAVGPVWRGGGSGEAELLASCYARAVESAASSGLRTLAFPAISCGAFGYPWEQAAEVCLSSLASALELHPGIERVRLMAFDRDLHEIQLATRERLAQAWTSARRR